MPRLELFRTEDVSSAVLFDEMLLKIILSHSRCWMQAEDKRRLANKRVKSSFANTSLQGAQNGQLSGAMNGHVRGSQDRPPTQMAFPAASSSPRQLNLISKNNALSFGFNVSDFLALLTLMTLLYGWFRNAPGELS